jgi:hypothetical protein
LDREDCGNAIIYTHTDKTRGIVYVDLNFKMILSDPEQISLAELLTKVIGVYATECYGELALSNMIGTYLGDTDVNLYTHQGVYRFDCWKKRLFFLQNHWGKSSEVYVMRNDVRLETFGFAQGCIKPFVKKFEFESTDYAAQTVASGD